MSSDLTLHIATYSTSTITTPFNIFIILHNVTKGMVLPLILHNYYQPFKIAKLLNSEAYRFE